MQSLNEQFKAAFGRDLCVGNGYRTLAAQYATKRSQGYLAATPGTSVHGWGLAIDLCGSDDTGSAKRWLEANGPIWGWENPSWAKSSKWEPWHWEYVPGTDDLGVYESSYWSRLRRVLLLRRLNDVDHRARTAAWLAGPSCVSPRSATAKRSRRWSRRRRSPRA
ncbi:M15 family metallopeptidase [Demequina litorisediminis]|uniref:M15 family metallopeptidase n=1 Tax=Demequina litorisediminis TaxID=1849022 RepID=UPI0024E0696F|nr:M15 family metallopeptidase [Demequina litorisediminis]